MKVNSGVGITVIALSLFAKSSIAASASHVPDSAKPPPAWVLEVYSNKATEQSGSAVRTEEVLFERTDLNGDGHTDWIVYSMVNCGSTGCTADAYAFINNKYCYVGWTRYGDAPGVLRNKYKNLKCKSNNVPLKEQLSQSVQAARLRGTYFVLNSTKSRTAPSVGLTAR